MAKKNGTTKGSSMNICNNRATVDREEKKEYTYRSLSDGASNKNGKLP